VEVEVTDTIGMVKEKVEALKSDLPASRQKLIHAGKVLKDESVLGETGITENDFIVCMVTKEAAKVLFFCFLNLYFG
jgi:UV excision repair protein RAD23